MLTVCTPVLIPPLLVQGLSNDDSSIRNHARSLISGQENTQDIQVVRTNDAVLATAEFPSNDISNGRMDNRGIESKAFLPVLILKKIVRTLELDLGNLEAYPVVSSFPTPTRYSAPRARERKLKGKTVCKSFMIIVESKRTTELPSDV